MIAHDLGAAQVQALIKAEVAKALEADKPPRKAPAAAPDEEDCAPRSSGSAKFKVGIPSEFEANINLCTSAVTIVK